MTAGTCRECRVAKSGLDDRVGDCCVNRVSTAPGEAHVNDQGYPEQAVIRRRGVEARRDSWTI